MVIKIYVFQDKKSMRDNHRSQMYMSFVRSPPKETMTLSRATSFVRTDLIVTTTTAVTSEQVAAASHIGLLFLLFFFLLLFGSIATASSGTTAAAASTTAAATELGEHFLSGRQEFTKVLPF
jgi:hypothetical protein